MSPTVWQRARRAATDGWRDRAVQVAAVLIVADIAWRAWIAAGGYLAVDDWVNTQRALRSMGPHLLLEPYNDHLQPGGWILYWLVTRLTGLSYWLYVPFILVGQAVTDVIFFRLMRRMLGRGWAPLVALAILQFSPITLEATTWVGAAIYLVPLQVSMVWALSAQERYIATRERRQLLSLGLAFAFGLAFYEKTLLVAPLVALFTACLFTRGGPLRSAWQALRTYWQAWVVLGSIAVVYAGVYVATSTGEDSVHPPAAGQTVINYLGQILGQTLIAGLFGGPVSWHATGEGTSYVQTPAAVTFAGCAVLLGLIVVTVARRRIATRAWTMLAIYTVVPVGMIAVTRLDSDLAFVMGLQTRYVHDVVVVAALCIGVAIAGIRGQDEAVRPLPRWVTSRPVVAAGAVVPLAMVVAAVASGVGYARAWADNSGHRYLRTIEAELAAAPPDAAFVELYVPERIIWPVNPREYRRQGNLLAAHHGPQPHFVTEGEGLLVIDEFGHIRPATVVGRSATAAPTPCGWPVEGTAATSVPLDGSPSQQAWAVSITYQSPTDTAATFGFGGVERDFPVRAGEHEYLFLIGVPWGSWVTGGDAVVRLHDPAASLCARDVVVGEVVPAP